MCGINYFILSTSYFDQFYLYLLMIFLQKLLWTYFLSCFSRSNIKYNKKSYSLQSSTNQCSHNALQVNRFNRYIEKPAWQVIVDVSWQRLLLYKSYRLITLSSLHHRLQTVFVYVTLQLIIVVNVDSSNHDITLRPLRTLDSQSPYYHHPSSCLPESSIKWRLNRWHRNNFTNL